jgi:hypothetical protein
MQDRAGEFYGLGIGGLHRIAAGLVGHGGTFQGAGGLVLSPIASAASALKQAALMSRCAALARYLRPERYDSRKAAVLSWPRSPIFGAFAARWGGLRRI